MAETPPQTTEIGLVLQGGGALGAYEYGAITALRELMDEAAGRGRTLKAVTGVSIGAVNAACVVGSANRTDAAAASRPCGTILPWRRLPFGRKPSSAISLLRSAAFLFAARRCLGVPSWTYIYDTEPLLPTLGRHIDFTALNKSETAFVVTAVDVESGVLKRFSNKQLDKTERTIIEPHHVLASGSLPPQFPSTDMKEGVVRHYWDGGIVDNTPLADAIDAFSLGADVNRLLVVMNLFPQTSRLPTSYFEVTERVDELRFGNRVHQDVRAAERVNMLASAIDELANLVPGKLPAELANSVAKARAMKLVNTVELTLEASPGLDQDDDYGFRDFSREGIELRKTAGRAIALDTLRPKFE